MEPGQTDINKNETNKIQGPDDPKNLNNHHDADDSIPAQLDIELHIIKSESSSINIDKQGSDLCGGGLKFEPLEYELGCVGRGVEKVTNALEAVWSITGVWIIRIVKILLALLCLLYVILSLVYAHRWTEPTRRLLWMSCLAAVILIFRFISCRFPNKIALVQNSVSVWFEKRPSVRIWIGRISLCALWLLVITVVLTDTLIGQQYYNLISLCGTLAFVLIYFVTSHSPAHVNWRIISWGVVLQYVFALIILRWDDGYNTFKWIGDRIKYFLQNADDGAIFLFGEGFREHYFAFSVLPKIIFFGSVISILYHVGIMQSIVCNLGWCLQMTLGTSAIESLNAAGNVFFGQSEVSLIVGPYVGELTQSEMHAVLTAGFATISGSLMALYMQYGAEAHHLIAASLMSAPAALAISKLRYPEKYKSRTTAQHVENIPTFRERNVFAAASRGVISALKLITHIAIHILAFTSLLAFLNQTLMWFGARFHWWRPEDQQAEPITFQFVCSYLLYPIPLLMGVVPQDCRQVAGLIGIKVFGTAALGYRDLGILIDNRVSLANHLASNGTWESGPGNDIYLMGNSGDVVETLLGGVISERSEVLAQYALCSLADVTVMGIMIGIFSGLAPHRRSDVSRILLSSMLAGNTAAFMTACVAGIFYRESSSK